MIVKKKKKDGTSLSLFIKTVNYKAQHHNGGDSDKGKQDPDK